MSPAELRIGNYISVNGATHEVKAIDLEGITTGKNYNYSEFTGYYPKKRGKESLATGNFGMRLSERWLISLKLENYEGRYAIKKYYTYIRIRGEEFYLEDGPGNVISIQLKYVHQLQNLYFALTGEELTIK